MYVLDTDVLSLFEHGSKTVVDRVGITQSRLIAAYDRLQGMASFLPEWQTLPFDHTAAHTFTDLVKRKTRISTSDLRIAAIALSRGFTVVTANVRHFRQVPSLSVQDWTKPTTG